MSSIKKEIPECTGMNAMGKKMVDKPRPIPINLFQWGKSQFIFFQQLTLIISGSASVSPVNRFLVLRNFLLLYLLSTVEEEACENGL